MKKVCVIGSNLYEVSDSILSMIKSENGFVNKIIVPDKFSMLAELGYFENTNNFCTFDTEVISISQLAYYLLDKLGVSVDVITSNQQALLVKKAIKNCSDKMTVVKPNTDYGFYSEFSKTISQLKSSKVDLTKCENINVSKINDFKTIVIEYEKLLNDKQDNNDLLDILSQNLTKCDFLKNTRFYFVGFDSFTQQAFEIFKTLSGLCDVYVGALVPCNKLQTSFYDLDIYNKIQSVGNFEYIMANKSFNFNQSAIENNLFNIKPNKMQTKTNFLSVAVAKTQNDEVDYVLTKIANQIKNGARAGDYCIAVSNLEEYQDLLLQKANMLGLSVYLDNGLCLKNCNLSTFVFNILKMIITGFSKSTVINFWLSDFVLLDYNEKSMLLNLINEYSLFEKNTNKITKYLSENAKKYYDLLNNFIKNTKKCNNVQQFKEILLNLLENFETEKVVLNTSEYLKNIGQIKQEKLYLQVYDKFINAINQACDILSDFEFIVSQFYDDFMAFCENVSVSTVPISSNCVYIGDATSSFFPKSKHLFIIGASGESLPQTIYDCGLILDDDIKNIKQLAKVSPTINMINKRNKFKLFNLCLCPSQSLNLVYSLTESGKDIPCYFVCELMEIFNLDSSEIINISQYFDFADKQSQIDYISNNLININSAIDIVLKISNKSYNNKTVTNSLYNVIKDDAEKFKDCFDFNNTKPNLENGEKLFFNNKKTKITQLEDYYNCPYLHFIRHGLCLQENKSHILDSRDIGNLLHYVAENFLKTNECWDNEKIEKFLNKLFENITNQEKFKKFDYNEENKVILKLLKKESADLCNALVLHKQNSNFNKYQTEYSFTDQIADLKINGFIDRLDCCEYKINDEQTKKLYRIVDYKSGNPSITAKDIYCGLQIQPAVYGAIIKKKLGDCSGIFLMPLKNQKSKDNYKLKGFFKKDESVVRKMDTTLNINNPSSNLINAKLSTKADNIKNHIFELSSGDGVDNLDDMLAYSYTLAQNAIYQIKQGIIDCLPYKNRCEFCQYQSICNFDKRYFNQNRECDFGVDESSFSDKNQD